MSNTFYGVESRTLQDKQTFNTINLTYPFIIKNKEKIYLDVPFNDTTWLFVWNMNSPAFLWAIKDGKAYIYIVDTEDLSLFNITNDEMNKDIVNSVVITQNDLKNTVFSLVINTPNSTKHFISNDLFKTYILNEYPYKEIDSNKYNVLYSASSIITHIEE